MTKLVRHDGLCAESVGTSIPCKLDIIMVHIGGQAHEVWEITLPPPYMYYTYYIYIYVTI